jgi:hypothetical protein
LQGLLHRNGVSKTVHHSAFKSFSEEQLLRMGIASNNPVSVRAIGFTIAQMHHQKYFKKGIYKLFSKQVDQIFTLFSKTLYWDWLKASRNR